MTTARKRTGEAADVDTDVRHTEALLKTAALQDAIISRANFSSIATDAKGIIQIFNVGAERMLDYTAADVIGKITPAEIFAPQEVSARAAALSVELGVPITPDFEALVFKASRGIEDIYELTYVRKDGSRVPAVVSVTALRDAQDAIIGYLLIGIDNTARKQFEEERKKLDQELRDKSTFDAAPIGIVHVGLDGRWLRVNQRLCDFLGYSRKELQSVTGQALVQSEEVAGEAESFLQMAAGTLDRHVVDEKRYRRRDGSFLWARVNMSVYRDAEGQAQYFIAVIEDITEQRTLEARRADAEHRTSLALDAGQMGTWDLDLATKTLVGSHGFDSILGYNTPDAGSSLSALFASIVPEDLAAAQRRHLRSPRTDAGWNGTPGSRPPANRRCGWDALRY